MENPVNRLALDPDEAIIERVVHGDIQLFEILIRRYNAVIYKIARSYGFNHQDAEDLMQDTHVSAYLSLKKFEGRGSYKTWISRIMINKCAHRYKSSSAVLDSSAHSGTEVQMENHTEQVMSAKEISIILEKSLQSIPAMYRTIFVLREVEGFSVAETAELLDITEINVKVRLNRAKSLLQKQIERSYCHTDLYLFNLVYCDAIVLKVFREINKQ